MKLNLMLVFSLALLVSCSKPKLNDMQSFTASHLRQGIKKACYKSIKDGERATKNCECALGVYDNSIKDGGIAFEIVTSNIPEDRAALGKKLEIEVQEKCNFSMR